VAETINFLYEIYGDEILDDTETISGIYSVCSLKTNFFVNDKVAVFDADLLAVRDIRSNKIFRYSYGKDKYLEVSPEEKVFYDALFIGYRDLLEPEFMFEDSYGYKYVFSSSSVVVDDKKVSLVLFGYYTPEKDLLFIYDIFAITCGESAGDKCSIYSFGMKRVLDNIYEERNRIPTLLRKTLLERILGSKKIQKKAKKEMAKELIKEHEWEILPA